MTSFIYLFFLIFTDLEHNELYARTQNYYDS